MLLLPVTRPWAVEPVLEALNASDVPREVLLVLDAPDCWEWFTAFCEADWTVYLVVTHMPAPPYDRIARRARHLKMRHLTQDVLYGFEGRILCIEDDTIVPPDVWSRLSALLDSNWYQAASGVQFSRDGQHIAGVWWYNEDAGIYDPIDPTHNLVEADAVGHYCLMTSVAMYCSCDILPEFNEPVDRAHTKHMAPIIVDGDLICGHLCADGTVIW